MEEKINLLMGQLDIAQKQALNSEARAEKSENESMFNFLIDSSLTLCYNKIIFFEKLKLVFSIDP